MIGPFSSFKRNHRECISLLYVKKIRRQIFALARRRRRRRQLRARRRREQVSKKGALLFAPRVPTTTTRARAEEVRGEKRESATDGPRVSLFSRFFGVLERYSVL
jgi:hypothetical protein